MRWKGITSSIKLVKKRGNKHFSPRWHHSLIV